MPRLKTHITVSALLRRAQAEGVFATVVHKGDPDAGVIFVKILNGREAALYVQPYEGGWTQHTEGFVEEREADAVIAKARDFDRDLWLVELEGAKGAGLLEG